MITEEIVEQTKDRVGSMGDNEGRALVNQMSKEQPAVLAYLMAMGENEVFNEDESQTLLYIGIVLWQIMRQSRTGTGQVSEKMLDAAEQSNDSLLEKLEADSPGDLVGATYAMVENHPEPEVLRSIVEALFEAEDGDADNPPMKEEAVGPAFVYLKTVLDGFMRLPGRNE